MTDYLNPTTRVGGVKQIVVADRATTIPVDDAPFDDEQYVRVNGEWVPYNAPPIIPDTLAPKPPTSLAGAGTMADNGTRVDYTVSWSAPTENTDNSPLTDFAYYVVRWRYAGVGSVYQAFTTRDTTFALPGLVPATNIEWGVLARDTSGNDSSWATHTITGVADASGPLKPSTPAVGSTLSTIVSSWDGLDNLGGAMPADFKRLDFFISTTGTGPWTFIGSVSGPGAVTVSGHPVGATRYISTIAYDIAGNASPRSTAVSIVVQGIMPVDLDATVLGPIQADVDAAQATADGKNTVYYSVNPPGTTPNVDGDIWWHRNGSNQILAMYVGMGGTTWQAMPLTNSAIATLDAAKITTGTLDVANRIAAKAIGVNKLSVGDLSNLSELDNLNAFPVAWNTWTTALSAGWLTRSGTRDNYFMFRSRKGPVPFKTGDFLLFTFEAYASVDVSVQIGEWLYTSADALLTYKFSEEIAITTTPATYSIPFEVTNDTTGAAAFLVGLADTALSTNDLFLRNVRVHRMGAGELVVDGSIVAGKLAAGAVRADNIAADAISANMINSGVMSAAMTITGYMLAGNPTGSRVVIDGEGIRQYDELGNLLTNLPTDPDLPATFEGGVVADYITIKDYMSLQGLANKIARGAVLTVESGTGAPSAAPSIAIGYPTYQPPSFTAEYLYTPTGHHCDIDDSDNIIVAKTFFGYGKLCGRGGKWWIGPEYTDSAGTKRTKYGNIGSATVVAVGGAERLIIKSVYTTGNGTTPVGRITSLDPATMNTSGTIEPTQKAQLNAKLDDYVFYFQLGRVLGGLSGTQYPERIAMGLMNYNSTVVETGKITLRQYTVTDNTTLNAGFTLVSGSEKVITSPLATNEELIGVTHGRVDKLYPGTLPAGVGASDFIWLVHGTVKTYAYDATTGMNRVTDFDFDTPPGVKRINAWGDTATNGFIGFRGTIWDDNSAITKMTNNHWVGSTSSKWWVSSTNYDSDITGGTHESVQSARSSITMKKRAGLVVTVAPYPVRPSPTTTDDPLSAKIYIGRGAADPTRANMEYAGQVDTPNRTLTVGNFTPPSGVASSPPPVTGNFPSTSAGKITSSDGTSWVLVGDGKATLAGVEFDGAIPGLKSSAMRAVEWLYTDATVFNTSLTTYSDCNARGARGTFVAPPSGAVRIDWSVLSRITTANQFASADVEVRTGATIGSGTVIRTPTANDSALNFNASYVTATHFCELTGLTPGATYNFRMMYASGQAGNTANFNRGRAIVTPSP